MNKITLQDIDNSIDPDVMTQFYVFPNSTERKLVSSHTLNQCIEKNSEISNMRVNKNLALVGGSPSILDSEFYSSGAVNAASFVTTVIAVNAETYFPFFLSGYTPTSSAYIEVTTAVANGKAVFALFRNSDETLATGITKPVSADKVWESGEIDCSTTGIKEITFPRIFLKSGLYFLYTNSNISGITFKAISVAGIPSVWGCYLTTNLSVCTRLHQSLTYSPVAPISSSNTTYFNKVQSNVPAVLFKTTLLDY